jgi:hypothetical protein
MADSAVAPRSGRHRCASRIRVYCAVAAAHGLHKIQLPCAVQLLAALWPPPGVTNPLPHPAYLALAHASVATAALIAGAAMVTVAGAGRSLSVSVAGTGCCFLMMPTVVAATGVSHGSVQPTLLLLLASVHAVLMGLQFPAVVALQSRWIPNPLRKSSRGVAVGRLEDVWAARTLSAASLFAELVVAAAVVAIAMRRGAEVAANGFGALLVATGGAVGLCASDDGPPRPPTHKKRTRPPPLFHLRQLFAQPAAPAIVLAASATGAALGLAQTFLPAATVQKGFVLVYVLDLAFGVAEAFLRACCGVAVVKIRCWASTIAPMLAAIGLLTLVSMNCLADTPTPQFLVHDGQAQ